MTNKVVIRLRQVDINEEIDGDKVWLNEFVPNQGESE